MKKLLTGFFVMILTMGMAISVNAAETPGEYSTNLQNGSRGTDFSVTAIYAPNETTKVYSVDVKWGAMKFRYDPYGKKGVWMPDELTYDTTNAIEKGWCPEFNGISNKITITNRSNVCVDIGFHYEPYSDFKNTNGIFTSDAEGLNPLSPQEFYTPTGEIETLWEVGMTIPHINYNDQQLTEEDITKNVYVFLNGEGIAQENNYQDIAQILIGIYPSKDIK